MDEIKKIGGVSLIYWHAFGSLRVNANELRISLLGLWNYSFTKDEVINIKKVVVIPILWDYIRIEHNVASYPDIILFSYFGSPQKLIDQIREIGFLPKESQPTPYNSEDIATLILLIGPILIFILIIIFIF